LALDIADLASNQIDDAADKDHGAINDSFSSRPGASRGAARLQGHLVAADWSAMSIFAKLF
jgi:hypothetical protein